jgi:hypothetical protein
VASPQVVDLILRHHRPLGRKVSMSTDDAHSLSEFYAQASFRQTGFSETCIRSTATLCVRIEAMALVLLHATPVECLVYGGADNDA